MQNSNDANFGAAAKFKNLSLSNQPDVLVRPAGFIHVGLIDGLQYVQALSDLWSCDCEYASHILLHLFAHDARALVSSTAPEFKSKQRMSMSGDLSSDHLG